MKNLKNLLLTVLFGLFILNAHSQDMKADVDNWPETAKKAAKAMMDKYGDPDEQTPSMLMWKDTGPFTHTIVYKEEIQHDFPMPHKDVLEQFINYDVPVFRHSPPIFSEDLSTSKTLKPNSSIPMAIPNPPEPDPITIRSYFEYIDSFNISRNERGCLKSQENIILNLLQDLN